MNFITNFAELFQESAPWLLLGLLIAGMMKWLVPIELLKRHMGGRNVSSVIKAALIGAPLPLCSCGVIPAAVGLRRSGASKSATVSFLVATPETGIDSISVSYALLGPFIAIIRPIAAVFSAVYVGLLTLLTDKDDKELLPQTTKQSAEKQSSCCESKPPIEPKPSTSCCGSEQTKSDKVVPESTTLQTKIVNVFQFASGKLLEDITRWLLLGLLLAAAIKTWVPTDFLTQWGGGLTAMLVMALIGIPMYICATASTPIAAGFLAVGVSPGAVLVFMLAGPATNISTMGMIRKELGTSVLIAYLLGILTASIGFGYLVNWAVSEFGFEIYKVAAETHQMQESLIYPVSAGLLALLMLRNLFK